MKKIFKVLGLWYLVGSFVLAGLYYINQNVVPAAPFGGLLMLPALLVIFSLVPLFSSLRACFPIYFLHGFKPKTIEFYSMFSIEKRFFLFVCFLIGVVLAGYCLLQLFFYMRALYTKNKTSLFAKRLFLGLICLEIYNIAVSYFLPMPAKDMPGLSEMITLIAAFIMILVCSIGLFVTRKS